MRGTHIGGQCEGKRPWEGWARPPQVWQEGHIMGTYWGMMSESYYDKLASCINSLRLWGHRSFPVSNFLVPHIFGNKAEEDAKLKCPLASWRPISCIGKFTWDKLSLLCSGLGQEMNLNVLALLPCNCRLAFMPLRREYLMAHIMGERDAGHKLIVSATSTLSSYPLWRRQAHPLIKQAGMKITTGLMQRWIEYRLE